MAPSRSGHARAGAIRSRELHPDSDSGLIDDLLREQRARLVPILTHEVPLEDIQQAFTKLESYQDGMAKVVIKLRG